MSKIIQKRKNSMKIHAQNKKSVTLPKGITDERFSKIRYYDE